MRYVLFVAFLAVILPVIAWASTTGGFFAKSLMYLLFIIAAVWDWYFYGKQKG